ncbi:Fc.00g009710.m01.CDS01 [Cosmosporella sp. VM-42]
MVTGRSLHGWMINQLFKQNFFRSNDLSNKTFGVGEEHKEAVHTTPPTDTVTTPASSEDIPFREAQLLVHYLDYIFPIQYPYYEDNPDLGGRGWLFWLLMKNGPLHQAILTLSALHQYTKFSYNTGNTEVTERELIGYHTNALQGLRQALHQYESNRFADNRDQLIEFLACGSALISFEVFLGGTANWQPHVDALTAVVNRLTPGATTEVNGVEHARRFLVANLVWFDLLACTSTGTTPKTAYKEWLENDIDMRPVMGCQNWIMIKIGDIARLNGTEWGVWDGNKSPTAVLSIQQSLQAGIRTLEAFPEDSTVYQVSRVFATAAIVELFAMGPPASTQAWGMKGAVDKVIEAIKLVPEDLSLRGLTWPICISGSMANPEQQVFFEDMMLRISGTSGPGFGNFDTVLRIMRQCWYHRESYPEDTWNWRDAMKAMGICALLV